jgi:hypothetical protein
MLSIVSPASRLALALALAGTLTGCGGSHRPQEAPAPAPTTPLPTAGLAGQKVVVYPLILVAADERLRWDSVLTPRRSALDHADSMLAETLTGRSPEVIWVLPPALRQIARRNLPVTTSPDQTPISLLRSPGLKQLPDPLWSQMRNLVAVAGERYALVPASLIFVPAPGGKGGRAELTLVLADVRSGAIAWRTVANAVAGDPWEGLARALKALTPWLP